MDVSITIIGYIDEKKRPEGFPTSVHQNGLFVNLPDAQTVMDAAEGMLVAITNRGYVIVNKKAKDVKEVPSNPPGLVDFDHFQIVPLHMITYFETMTLVLPQASETPKGHPILRQ